MSTELVDCLARLGIPVERREDRIALCSTDQRGLMTGMPLAVACPESTAQMAALVREASRLGVAIVPHGGNTSYCGGATPDGSGNELLVSLERLRRVRSIDPFGFSMALDAGVILANAQQAAAEHGLYFPLSLGSEGSCQVGGNAATNAGGLTALRYGVMRDLLLGLEVVLPDGTVLDEMKALRKNTAGYDVRQLFVGSEGTMGIITGVTVKLFPRPVRQATVWATLAEGARLSELLTEIRRETGDLVTSFEFMSRASLSLHGDDPLPVGPNGVLLFEISTSTTRIAVDELLEQVALELLEKGLLDDAVIAASEQQRRHFWHRRETIPEAEKKHGGAVKHDISVPLSGIDDFIARAEAAVRDFDANLKTSFYGHVGDGNVHYNVLCPAGRSLKSYGESIEDTLSREIYEIADRLGGTFSAEHGIGRFKRELLEQFASAGKRDVMRRLKSALDPKAIFNPGSVV